ncbi:MAG: hypothetical protein J2P28_00195 [Actinobacteria bacterium]|nr:hypothetical protein [Actinomycetota bacterium]MBO0833920.1 hypothetical protein [Actinomycetota bacterium]
MTKASDGTEAGGMFERFTDKARRVIVLGQEEARLLRHASIGTDHILLGLLREGDGVAARALDSLGIQLQSARDRLATGARRGRSASGHIPFTAEAKRTFDGSLREAIQLGYAFIGAEHLLLGMIRDTRTRGARILAELGADADTVRQRVIEIAPTRPAGSVGSADGAHRLALPSAEPRALTERATGYGALSSRLAALERWAGLVPDLAELDEQIAQVRQGTEAAIDAHEFRTAEALSDTEHELMAERDRLSRQHTSGPSLADQVARLQAEVDRLRGLLRRHGIDPGKSAGTGTTAS